MNIQIKPYKAGDNEVLGYDILIDGQVTDQIFKRLPWYWARYTWNGHYYRYLRDAKKDVRKYYANNNKQSSKISSEVAHPV